jgi:hypothetical protein
MLVYNTIISRIIIGLFLIMLTCGLPASGAAINNGTVTMDNVTPNSTLSDSVTTTIPVTMGAEVTSATMVFPQKTISPAVQRKISTNLLYMIDTDAPPAGLSRDVVQNQMVAEGKLRTIPSASSSGTKSLGATPATTPASNLVLVYIDLVPTATTSAIDTYVSSVTERNEQDHSVVAWVDTNNLDTLASLDAVNYVRTAEPSVTKESPVYHDMKFVNKRAGLPPATVEEAKESVREFEKIADNTPEYKETKKFPQGDVYVLTTESGWYYIDKKTGEIILAQNIHTGKTSTNPLTQPQSVISRNKLSHSSVTIDEAFTIAQDYAGINYFNFYNRSMVLSQSRIIEDGDAGKTILFVWIEKINEISSPNGVMILINQNNGDTDLYTAIDQPVDVNIVPAVSRDDAINKAIGAFSPIFIENSSAQLVVLPADANSQHLVWLVNLYGTPKDMIKQGGEVLIDAHSGEIERIYHYN